MYNLKVQTISISLLLFPLLLIGQSNLTISHQTKDYGLYYRWVHDITQDKNGFIWMGNHTGLRVYDGNEFTTFRHVPGDTNSISVNSIYRICSVGSHIWALGNDGIFNRVDIASENVKRIPSPYNSSPPSSKYRLIHFTQSKEGELLILYQLFSETRGNSAVEMWKYDSQVNSFKKLFSKDMNGEDIYHFSQRDNNDFWLWTKMHGYYLVDHKSFKIRKFGLDEGKENGGSLATSAKEKVRLFWYPNNSAIDSNYLLTFALPKKLNIDELQKLSVDNRGGIWFYNGDEVYRFDREKKKLEHFVDPMFKSTRGLQKMQHFFVDEEGGYWNGHSVGAVRFKARQNLFGQFLNEAFASSDFLSFSTSIRQIMRLSSDQLLLRSDEQEFAVLDIHSKKFTLIDLAAKNKVPDTQKISFYSAFTSKDGSIWANTENSIYKIDLLSGIENAYLVKVPIGETKVDNDQVPKIFEDNDEKKWWCDHSGVYQFDTSSQKLTISKAGSPLSSLNLDFEYASFDSEENAIYGVYKNGIYIFSCDTEQVSLVEAFPNNESFDILTTDIHFWKGFFWLATNKGLIKVDPQSGEKTTYTRRQGLASTLVYSIMGTENDLWLGTQNGLSQFNPLTLQTYNYYTEEGLTSNEFNSGAKHKGLDGRIYFGSQKGMIGFQPELFTMNFKQKGTLHLTNFLTYNKKNDALRHLSKRSDLSKKIEIKANEKNVELRFALTLFEDFANHQYSYFLEGIDNSWVDNGNNNLVRFSHLPPGKYNFHLKAKGPSKLPAENEISIPFIVKEHWYKTKGSFLFYIIAFLFGTWKFYKYQLAQKIEKQEAKRIKEVDDLRTKMYTNITHEFRTPLTVILGMNNVISEMVQNRESEKLKVASEMIDRNGKDLLGLVNQLLDLSKLQAGKLNVSYIQGNIVAYIRYLTESLSSLAEEKSINFHFNCEKESIMMDYDKEKTSHIVLNLISNAIKFTDEKGNVYVDIKKENDLKIIVRDDGIGIRDDQIDKIFDRFYQSDISHTRKNEGTGIGLFLVKELLRLLKGKIDVKSTFKEGSEFIVSLPISNNAPLESTRNNQFQRIGEEDKVDKLKNYGNGFDKRNLPLLMIVEDNLDVASYIGSVLEQDYRLLFAKNGEEGIEESIKEIPDLIISDVMMPKKDGFELCSALKKNEKTSHIPVILLTAKADVDSKIAGLGFGADAYLAKPFDGRELQFSIRNLLSLRDSLRRRFQASDFSKEITDLSKNLDPFLLKVKEVVLEYIDDENFSVSELCLVLHISRAQLHRKLTALTGKSTSHLIRSIRLEKAQALLINKKMNISEVAYSVGFKTQAHFSRVFSEAFGLSPREFQSKTEK